MSNGSLKNSFPSPSQAEVDAFVLAAGLGDKAALAAFLDRHPAAIGQKSASGNAALTWAASQGLKETVRLLLDKGAGIETRDKNGRTALFNAAAGAFGSHIRGDLQGTVALLLTRSAEVEAQDERGWTPLMHAAWSGRTGIVKALWERGAQIDARSKNGLTALMLAANMGRTATVAFLLEKGADTEAADASGRTAALMAFERGYHDPARLIAQREEYLRRCGKNFSDRFEKLKKQRPPQPPFGNGRK